MPVPVFRRGSVLFGACTVLYAPAAFDDCSIANPLALIIGAQRSVSVRIRLAKSFIE
jgi:hypothetical protein